MKEASCRWGSRRGTSPGVTLRTEMWPVGLKPNEKGRGRADLCVLENVYPLLCGKKPWFVAFANFCGARTSTVAFQAADIECGLVILQRSTAPGTWWSSTGGLCHFGEFLNSFFLSLP